MTGIESAHTAQDGPSAWEGQAPVVHQVRVARLIERDACERTVTPCHSAKEGGRLGVGVLARIRVRLGQQQNGIIDVIFNRRTTFIERRANQTVFERTVAGMTNAIDDPRETTPGYLETMEDFRAKATAFSQLTGVLGGFSMTILVLVVGLLGENKAARDWTVALLLLAATAYIYASGTLANSMNASTLGRASAHPREVRIIQGRVFNYGIGAFHVGNFFLPAAIVITVYQEALWIGLAASVIVFLLAAHIIRTSIRVAIKRRAARLAERDDNPDDPGRPGSSNESGLGWPA